MKGFVKISRNIINSVYYTNPKLLKAWLTIIVHTRFTETEENGIEIKAGQALFTKYELISLLDTDARGVRTILDRFRRDGNIEIDYVDKQHTLITVINQEPKKPARKKKDVAKTEINENEYTDAAITYDKNVEKAARDTENTEKEKHTPPKTEECEKSTVIQEPDMLQPGKNILYLGEFHNVRMTADEYEKLKNNVCDYRSYISKLSSYLINFPEKKYRSHYGAIISWASEDNIKHNKNKRDREENGNNPTDKDLSEKTDKRISNASYDIEAAESAARRRVPPVIKKDKLTGRWIPATGRNSE